MGFGTFNFQEFISAFIILFAVIDAVGSTPIIISLREGGKTIKPISQINSISHCQHCKYYERNIPDPEVDICVCYRYIHISASV